MSSAPRMPSGNPGKFSTSVVVVSWPPGAMSLAIQPSKRIGLSSARAAYTAAVWAAGPLPMMQSFVFSTFRSSIASSSEEEDGESPEEAAEGEDEDAAMTESEEKEAVAEMEEANPRPMRLRALVKSLFVQNLIWTAFRNGNGFFFVRAFFYWSSFFYF